MLRLTLALILVLMGGSLVGNAFLFSPSVPEFLRRLAAAWIGACVAGSGVYVLGRRRRATGPIAIPRESPSMSLGDGFAVFGLASLAFNTLMMASGTCDLDPTLDGLHLIPAMLMNEVWEGLISSSGGSFLLTSGGIAIFDACIGSLIGLVLFPLQRLAPMRILRIIVLLFCFAAFEASAITWAPFKC